MLSPLSKEAGSATWSDPDTMEVEPAVEGRGRRPTVVSRSNSRTHSRSGSALRSFVRSRRNSTANLKNLPESKVSLVSTTQSDIDAAIRLLQEVRKNASPEDLAALRECPWIIESAAQLEMPLHWVFPFRPSADLTVCR